MVGSIVEAPMCGTVAATSSGGRDGRAHVQVSHEDAHGEKGEAEGLVKKPAGFTSSSREVIKELGKRCEGGHSHVPLVEGRAAGAAIYPQAFARRYAAECATSREAT